MEEDDADKGSCAATACLGKYERYRTLALCLYLETVSLVCLCFCICCRALGFATSCCVADGLSLPLGISALNTSRCGDPVENKLCMRLAQKLTPLGREAHLVTVGHYLPLLKRATWSLCFPLGGSDPLGGRFPTAEVVQEVSHPPWHLTIPKWVPAKTLLSRTN